MTTWDNTDISAKRHNVRGRYWEITYEITGVSGDTGGTLTVGDMKILQNAYVTACTASAACAALTWRISSNTVVVAYTNPSAGHTVYITVHGIRG